jgi:hypothetical protein
MITRIFGLNLHQNKYSSILTLSDLAVRHKVSRKKTPIALSGVSGLKAIPDRKTEKTYLPCAQVCSRQEPPHLKLSGFFFASDRLARRDNQDTRARGNLAMRERLRARWGGEGQSPYPNVCRVNVAPKVIVLKELREGWVPSTKGHPA